MEIEAQVCGKMRKGEGDTVMAAKEPVKCERENPITNHSGLP